MSMDRNEDHAPQMPLPKISQRHTPYQCQKLKEYFNECQYPEDKTFDKIGREIGLTPIQVKFWFQNKRTILKEQTEREEGITLRYENNQLKSENHLLKEWFKEFENSRWCCSCRDIINPMTQLRAQNLEIRQKYSEVCNLLVNNGIHIPRNSIIKPPLVIGQTSREQHLDSETTDMIQTLLLAREELTRLLHVDEPFWVKDTTDGRYKIQREVYNSTFLKNSTQDNHNPEGSRTRFESSKYEAVLCMSAVAVAELLMDSKKRLNIFPTILTEAFTIQEYGNKISPHQVGHLKLVYEQMHMLTPFAVPREFYYVRFCENIEQGVWLIAEVSLDFLTRKFQLNSPTSARRLPSGCIIKDISPGVSRVTWIEHVEIDVDNTSIHLLYKDVFLRGLAFCADRWVEILSRSCHIINSYNNPLNQFIITTQNYMGDGTHGIGSVLTQDDKKCVMSLTDNIMKRFCMYMNMKNIPDTSNMNEICLSLCQGEECSNSTNGLVVNASTTFWLPAPCQMIIDFLKDANLRAQWDVICEGNPGKEVASIRFGDEPNNSISMIQTFGQSGKNILLVQESLVDPLGAIIVYAPIKMEDLNGELNGSSSSHILPSGFIIFKDGNPDCLVNVGGASASNNVGSMANGSLITVAFQVASFSNNIETEFANILTSLISSTVRNIKLAFTSPDPTPTPTNSNM